MIHLPEIYEQEDGWCGPASLQMVLAYYGLEKPQSDLARSVGATHQDGCDPIDLVDGARYFGFKSRLIQNLSPEESMKILKYWVNERQVPVIVDWTRAVEDHFSVVVDVGKKLITHADPYDVRIRRYDPDFFLYRWEGYYHQPPKDLSDIFLRAMVVIEDI